MENTLYDKNMQLSILRGVLEDALVLMESKKAKRLLLPTFRSAIVEQTSDATYKLIQSPFELLTNIEKEEWLQYSSIRSSIHMKETKEANVVNDNAELVFIVLVFEHGDKFIFALKSVHQDVDDYVCEIYKKDISKKTIVLNTDWEESGDLDFLKGVYTDAAYYH